MEVAPFVLLDDSLRPDGSSFFYRDPEAFIACHDASEVSDSITQIQDALDSGYHAAGFFAYELGYLLEPKLEPLLPENRDQPLIWVGLFKSRECWTEDEVFNFVEQQAGMSSRESDIRNVTTSMNKHDYLRAFQKAQDYISAGDVYQINLTLKLLFDYVGNPFTLYRELRRKQKVAYGGIIHTPDFTILSLSPELYFKIEEDGKISARPMKGTAPRGHTPEEDQRIAEWLRTDEKSRAENLMIVDLLRNDLGRISEIGSVKVTDLFTVENYRTVLQMTSGITAQIEAGRKLTDILTALFPCGSITGAPKVRAMEIIRELETLPRGVYTGALGFLSPDRKAAFNVSIRTLVLNKDGKAEMGIGSGVVSDSKAEDEFDECLLKAQFLTREHPTFSLIETMRYQKGKGFYLLERHLHRLKRSADHFGFRYDHDSIMAALNEEAENLHAPAHMVRLLLDERGNLTTTNIVIELPKPHEIWRFALSDQPLDQDDHLFYHKTTRRDFYTNEFNRYHEKFDTHDVVFLNKHGELTEGSRTNIFVEKNGELFTPPIKSGLLAGTLRAELLDTHRPKIIEKTMYRRDLEEADKIFLGNSVRGLVEAKWVNR